MNGFSINYSHFKIIILNLVWTVKYEQQTVKQISKPNINILTYNTEHYYRFYII